MKVSKIIICIYGFMFLVFFSCGSGISTADSLAGKPNWVPSPKPNPLFLYGIGVADFNKDAQTTIDQSRVNAVSDLAYQISSSITSSVADTMIEKNGWRKESFKQCIQLSTEQYIKNWEIVDRWENPVNGQVWTWIRLGKEQYEIQKKEEFERIKSIALKNLRAIDNNIVYSNSSEVVSSLLSGLYHTRFFYTESVEVEFPKYSGIKINLDDAIRQRTSDFLKNISLITIAKPEIIIGGLDSGLRIAVKAAYITSPGKEKPFSELPIQFKILDENLVEKTILTDKEGIAICPIKYISPFITNLEIRVSINFNQIHFEKENEGFSADIDFNKLLHSPTETLRIPVRPPKFLLNTKEKIQGRDISRDRRYVSTAIQETLTDEMNAQFVYHRSEADYVINLTVDSKFGGREKAKSGWLYFYYADTRVALVTPDDGTELYSFYLEPRSKEYGRNDSEAADRTLRKAAAMAKKYITPNLVKYFNLQENK